MRLVSKLMTVNSFVFQSHAQFRTVLSVLMRINVANVKLGSQELIINVSQSAMGVTYKAAFGVRVLNLVLSAPLGSICRCITNLVYMGMPALQLLKH